MSDSSPARAATARLVAVLVLGVLFLAVIGLYGTQTAHDEGTRAIDEALASSALLDEARTAQVTFKIQVQDWKNFLLRGHNPADLARYQEQFSRDAQAVDAALGRLLESPLLPPELTAEVRAIREQHAALGKAYADARAAFQPGETATTFRVDASVRGIDQELTKRIDGVAERILASERDLAARLKEEFAARYRRLQTTVTIATLVVLGLLVVVVRRLLAARR